MAFGPKGVGERCHEYRDHCVLYALKILQSGNWLMVGKAYHPFSLFAMLKSVELDLHYPVFSHIRYAFTEQWDTNGRSWRGRTWG